MYSIRPYVAVATLLAAPSSVAPQGTAGCPLIVIDGVIQSFAAGPGEAFGVTGYQCASCGFKREKDARSEYSFNAEPIVLQTTAWSQLRVGDIIEAVNGLPITTRAAADQFTYPPAGESVITVRRGGSRVEVKAVARQDCGIQSLDANRIQRIEVLKGPLAASLYGREALGGVLLVETKKVAPTLAPGAAPSADSVRGSPTEGRFGFAISCLSCTRVRASDGTEYWKFDGYPPIAGIRPGGPAAMAGMGVGDIVTEIDGISILSDEGALRFLRSGRTQSLHVTVLRNGKKIEYVLQP